MGDDGETESSGSSFTPGTNPEAQSTYHNNQSSSLEYNDYAKHNKPAAYCSVPLGTGKKGFDGNRHYSPLRYVKQVVMRACGSTAGSTVGVHPGALHGLRNEGITSIQDVRQWLSDNGYDHRHTAIAAAYAECVDGFVPRPTPGVIDDIIRYMDMFLQHFYWLREKNELPYRRKHEPHTGSVLKRICHYLDYHHMECAFRELQPRQMKVTGAIIKAVFDSCNWEYEEPCGAR